MCSALQTLSPNSSPAAEEPGAKELAQQIRFKVQTHSEAFAFDKIRSLLISQWGTVTGNSLKVTLYNKEINIKTISNNNKQKKKSGLNDVSY